MARKRRLRAISVYVTEKEYEQLQRAADLGNRSLSNYLLTSAISRAEDSGIRPFSLDKESATPHNN